VGLLQKLSEREYLATVGDLTATVAKELGLTHLLLAELWCHPARLGVAKWRRETLELRPMTRHM